MRLGGTVVGSWSTLGEWEALLRASRFRAITAPFDHRTPKDEIRRFMGICLRNDVVVAEAGVWKNPFAPDPEAAEAAFQYAVGQLAMARGSPVFTLITTAAAPVISSFISGS